MIKKHIVSDSSQIYFDFGRAEGSFIWDKAGKNFIDFTSGWNVANLGWEHPEIKEAIKDQLEKASYSPSWVINDIQEKYAEELVNALPEELNTIIKATGGTEANEEAIKIARAYTGRTKIIGFKNSYHGQSAELLALVYEPSKIMGSAPSEYIQVDFPEKDLSRFAQNLEQILKRNDVAAIIAEAGIVTGGGQTSVAPEGFLKKIRELTEKYNTLLILDEVGTGFSRCGQLFGMEIEGVVPDMATFAKGISNGTAAIGAVALKEEIAKKTEKQAVLISTFGWTALACTAASKVLEIHKRDKIWEKAQNDGRYVLNILNKQLGGNPKIKAIRGIGMEIGVLFTEDVDVKAINQKLFNAGLLVAIDYNNLQLMPPLTIEREILDEGLGIFVRAVKE